MSEMKNPLFEDLDAKIKQEKQEIVEAPPQLVTDEEMSQLRKRQIELKTDPAVLALAEKIDVRNQIAVLEFGKETANAISKFSDRMLASIKQSKLEKSSELINHLNKIMSRFDPEDFKEEKQGFFARLFGKGKEQLQKILSKYETMNKEIDAIYHEITKYEQEMKKNTIELEQMYEQNLEYFKSLSEHIAAIEVKLETLKPEVERLQALANEGDQEAVIELETLGRAIELLEQRRYDLEMAQQVAFQAAPQIRLMQQGNNHLIAKINSAFVTTIPIFKQGLIHAVTIKRQKLVSDSMQELDKRTNEMLMRNSENIRRNSVEIARTAGQPSIKIETIEQTWRTILAGIEETKQIQEETVHNREEGRKRLEQLQLEYEKLKRL
ncbi:toxic anion resistance protein [Ureibacillus terrenus]|uniref:Toxic anion resistance protein n=1 Tax=Ureibacillus terrenus TaxID=118246 RepID=A0A540V7L3_9BACL|nr:toxic anion resistance protein [Ureibacillus terrenus]MED3660865.1 toxic anion resistance protein [Ureibacillus terrenus]MED3764636.1 toxic anion resistance protein [Ureibacillus terrenus]TQE92153.1 toxic anion resistance protein [Ureibacillus terrenus]